METSEIMNEEIVETAEEVIENASNKGFKTAVNYGIAAVCGFVAGNIIRKYVVKPIVEKVEEKREVKKYAKAFSNDENDEDIFEED